MGDWRLLVRTQLFGISRGRRVRERMGRKRERIRSRCSGYSRDLSAGYGSMRSSRGRSQAKAGTTQLLFP